MSFRTAFVVALVGIGLSTSCVTRTYVVTDPLCDGGVCAESPPPLLGSASDASVDVNVNAEPLNLCPTNECPPGRATCPSHPFPCEVDLMSDNLDCGECGHACPKAVGGSSLSSMECVNGKCILTCRAPLADCNGLVEDGCETNTQGDNANCGACGVVCPALHQCRPNPSTGVFECACSIVGSCGACGHVCDAPPEPLPPFQAEWHATYGCSNGECYQPICNPGYSDCNGDFSQPNGDGCEANIKSDTANCGACGVECQPGEVCSNGKCTCKCGSICFKHLDSDILNCGACGVECAAVPNSHQDPICNNGTCEYRCFGAYADCDQDPTNGCESNTLVDPFNCGGCGIRCNGVDGQACVNGRCATKDCGVR